MTDLEFRSAPLLRAKDDTDEVEGVACPWDTATSIGGWYTETIQRGAVDLAEEILFFAGHEEVIGRVVEQEDRDEGLWIRAKISDTARGRDTLTLLRDKALPSLSIGFESLEQVWDDEANSVIRTKIRVREVSAVPFGAYPDAKVTAVRNQQTSSQVRGGNQKENKMDTATKADLDEVRSLIEDLDRRVETIPTVNQEPVVDNRSAGEVLKAIAAGDQSTIDAYEQLHRDYSPNVVASAVVKPGWVGNLTRIFDASSGVLAGVFSTGTLPSTGMSIEYAQLASNTIDVAAQSAEHAAIAMGNVSIETKTASVVTYAGGTTLSRQAIERATVGILNTSLEAMATAAGARKKTVLRAAFDALVTARRAVTDDAAVVKLGGASTAAKLSTATAGSWEDTLIDAALWFDAIALPMDALIVNGLVFKHLRGLTISGERVFQTWKDNASGELNLPGLRGQLSGLPVLLDSGVANTAAHAVFANGRAIRQYDSGLVSLSDESILTLAKSFAVYKYGAVAAEIPAAVLPVKVTAE